MSKPELDEKRAEPAGLDSFSRSDIWNRARAARDQGRLAQAAAEYSRATASNPITLELQLEAAECALALHARFAGVERLFARHERSFDLGADGRATDSAGSKFGQDGLLFAIDCLERANAAEGSLPDVQERLATALETSGQLQRALNYRRNVATLGENRRDNEIAIGRLLEYLGSPTDASNHLELLLSRWPNDPAILLNLARLFRDLGREAEARKVLDDLDRLACAATDMSDPGTADNGSIQRDDVDTVKKHWPNKAQEFLKLAWAAVEIGSERVPLEFVATLRARCGNLANACPRDPVVSLVKGYIELLSGNTAVATRSLRAASFAMEAQFGRHPDRLTSHALGWARAFIGGLSPLRPNEEPPPTGLNTRLNFAHAHETLMGGDVDQAVSRLVRLVESYYFHDIPIQYEIIGDYKVAYHGRRFYAVPRGVPEFTIIGQTVYRLTESSPLMDRQIPPVILWPVLRFRRYAIHVANRVPFVRWTGSRLRQAARRLLQDRFVKGICRRIALFGWQRYAVKGVIQADQRSELITLIDRRSAGTSASYASRTVMPDTEPKKQHAAKSIGG